MPNPNPSIIAARNLLLAGVTGIALCVASAGASAAVISATFNQPLSATPVGVSFNGVGAFLFTGVSTGFGPGAAVATSGTAAVTTVFGSVSDFFSGATIDATGLYSFARYPRATTIPFSAADDFIGLSLALTDGVHFGYAEVAGSNLVSVGFESRAGATILTGAIGEGAGITLNTGSTAMPEPASAALLLTGMAVLGVGRRRTRAAL